MIVGLIIRRSQKGRGCVQEFAVVVEPEIPVKLVCSGLGENLDAAIAELVILRGKWIRIDPDLPDGRFGRKCATREAVNVDLAPIRTGRWPCQSAEFALQIIGIIGEGVQRFPGDDRGAGVAFGVHTELSSIGCDVDLLHLLLDGHLHIGGDASASSNGHVLLDEYGKTWRCDTDGVSARGDVPEGVRSITLGGRTLAFARSRGKCDGSVRYKGVVGIKHAAVNRSASCLRERGGRQGNDKAQQENQPAISKKHPHS